MTSAIATQLRYGTGVTRITPRVPVTLSGYFNVRMWDHVLDDLYVQALVVRDAGGKSFTLILLDVVGVPEVIVERVRSRLAGVPNVDAANLLITCTHTHTAPAVQAEPGSNPAYVEFLVDQTVAAVKHAAAELRPGELRFARGHDDRFAFCRRWWTKSGTVVTNPAVRDPDLLGPEGPVDPAIPVLSIWADGRPAVVLANLVNHTDVIGGTGVSGDWPGLLRPAVARRLGGNVFVMPLIGASGDVAHNDFWRESNPSGYAGSRAIAEGYAHTIAAAVTAAPQDTTCDALHVARTTFTAGPREITDDQITAARSTVAATVGVKAAGDLTAFDLALNTAAAQRYFAEALLQVAAGRRERIFDVFAVRLGPATLISLPGEPFCAYGLKIKRDLLAGRPAIVVTHGNALCDYIPMRHHYANGGYEVTPAVSPLSVTAGEAMLAAVERTLKEL